MDWELIFGIILTVFLIGNQIFLKKMDKKIRDFDKQDSVDVEYEVLSVKKIGFFKRRINKIKNFVYNTLFINLYIH